MCVRDEGAERLETPLKWVTLMGGLKGFRPPRDVCRRWMPSEMVLSDGGAKGLQTPHEGGGLMFVRFRFLK